MLLQFISKPLLLVLVVRLMMGFGGLVSHSCDDGDCNNVNTY